MPIAPGTKLGQYEVQDFIGQGAMGLVYRAYHVQLQRTGAVKVLQGIAPDPDSTARFRHEAQAIAQMRHPNIVNVYDFGEHDGVPYMIIEFVPGGSLANKLSNGPLDTATALKYLRGIAAGLDHAHGLGIVHRDVKPANVLLEKDDTPVLADFGLAKLLQGSSLKSMTGVTTGTPAYMAPEQVTGSMVGPAADRYALATIAYEMLTGVIPFDGEGLMELLYAHVHREPSPPSARNHALGPRVDAVIMRGLAKDPAARWESCSAMVDALAAALARPAEPAVSRTVVMAPPQPPPPPPSALDTPATFAAPTFVDTETPSDPIAVAYPSPPPIPKPRSHRGRNAILIAAALVVLLIVGIAGYLTGRPNPVVSLTPSTVAAGDSVLLTASNLPANQSGEIRLHSELRVFQFQTDSYGNLRQSIAIPRNAGIGGHTIQVCWASVCHLTAILQVLEPVALATPTPTETASPTASPTPASTPSQSPRPTSSLQPYISVPSISKTKGFTVAFHNFLFVGTWTVDVIQSGKSYLAGSAAVPGGAPYSQSYSTPALVVSLVDAYVIVCPNTGGSCLRSVTVRVAL
ncbi:MAG TPA: serine/threonine-protein kinase [Candidatus Acidoferrum sp.]|nr:serine/threonine-protein kinase [Candidatus Acidoferrum sp.]